MDEFGDDVRAAQEENAAEGELSDEAFDEGSDEVSDKESDEESEESNEVVRIAIAHFQAGETTLE
jgi:hypothetical protein